MRTRPYVTPDYEATRARGLATAALVLGVSGILFIWPFLGWQGFIGVVVGWRARREARSCGERWAQVRAEVGLFLSAVTGVAYIGTSVFVIADLSWSPGWAIAWAVYSVVVVFLTALALSALHSKSIVGSVGLAFMVFLAWGMHVSILIDNCGGGGGCDPYKGILGWPEGKAAFWASLPIVVAAAVTEIAWLVAIRRARRSSAVEVSR